MFGGEDFSTGTLGIFTPALTGLIPDQHLLSSKSDPGYSSRASLSGSAALEPVPKQAAVLGSLKQLRGYFHPVIEVNAWV
jgi:hypothetical protein